MEVRKMAFARLSNSDLITFSKNWGWYLAWGILLLFLGIIAIGAATTTTLISVIVIGIFLSLGGIIILIDTFVSWPGKWGGFFLHLVLGILYLIAGFSLIKSPVLGSMSITFILAIFYIVIGIYRIIYSLFLRLFSWQWVLLNGIVSLLLGFLIIANWPASSLIIIGLFVGIDLIFCGFAYIMASLSARKMSTKIA